MPNGGGLHSDQYLWGADTDSPPHEAPRQIDHTPNPNAASRMTTMTIFDWMQTYTGVQFWPLDPRMEDIRFADIATALSRICRFGGHCTHFYSVAEHSVHVASKAPTELKLQALMHDAAEAYLGDVVRAIKRNLPNYERHEARLGRMIAEKFGYDYPCHPTVKMLDDRILNDEREQNMAAPPAPWHGDGITIGVELKFWTPSQSCFEFTSAFFRYGGTG